MAVQKLSGPVSPTPREVYAPCFFKGRIWLAGGAFEGVGFIFRAPYSGSFFAAEALLRATHRKQITRFALGPMTKRQLNALPRQTKDSPELRPAVVFERLGRELGVDWAA